MIWLIYFDKMGKKHMRLNVKLNFYMPGFGSQMTSLIFVFAAITQGCVQSIITQLRFKRSVTGVIWFSYNLTCPCFRTFISVPWSVKKSFQKWWSGEYMQVYWVASIHLVFLSIYISEQAFEIHRSTCFLLYDLPKRVCPVVDNTKNILNTILSSFTLQKCNFLLV